MLLTKLETASKLTKDLYEAEQRVQAVKVLQNFSKQIDTLPKGVQEFSDSLSTLHKHFPQRFPKQDLQSVLDNLNLLEAELEKDAPKDRPLTEAKRILQGHDNLLHNQWKSYAREETIELVKLLDSLQGMVGAGMELAPLKRSLETLRDKWPLTEANVKHFAGQLQDAKNRLSVLQVGMNIKLFLEKVANQEATVEDLTDEVMAWLSQHQYKQRLQIRFA